MILRIFSCVYWPSVCLLWEIFVWAFCPFFDWVVCFPHVELYELLIYSGDESFFGCIIGNYFLSFWDLCFNPVYFLCYANFFFNLFKSHFHYFKATTPFLNAATFSWYLIINVSSSVLAICCLKDTQPFSAYLHSVQIHLSCDDAVLRDFL